MNIIQHFEAEQIARLTAAVRVPDFAPGDTVRVDGEGGRGRAHPHPGL